MRNQGLFVILSGLLLILLWTACSISPDTSLEPETETLPLFTNTPQPTQTSTLNPTPTALPTLEIDYDCNTSSELPGVDLYFEDGKLSRMGNGQAYAIDWSKDGSMIAIGAETGLYIIDANTMEKTLFIDTGFFVRHVLFSPDGKWVGTDFSPGFIKNDNEIKNEQKPSYKIAVWNTQTGDFIGTYGENINTIGSHEDINREIFSFSHDSQHITFGTQITTNKQMSSHIEVWDIAINKMMQSWDTTEFVFPLPQFAPDNNYIVSAWEDGITIFDFNSGKEMYNYPEYSGYATIFIDSNHIVVHEMKSGDFFILNIETGERKFFSSTIDSYRTNFLYNGEHLLIYSNENNSPKIQTWDISLNKRNTISLIEPVIDIQYNSQNHEVATMDRDQVLRVWDIEDGSLLRSYQFSSLLAEYIYPSQDGSNLITYLNDQFHILDTKTGEYLCSCEGNFSNVNYVSFSPYGNYFAAISKDGDAKVWNSKTGKLLDEITFGNLIDNGFSSNHYLAYKTYNLAGTENPFVYFAWDDNQTDIENWIGKSRTFSSTAISKSGDLIAILTNNNIDVLNLNTGQYLVKDFKDGSTPLAFSPNEKYILTSDFYDSSIHIFSISNMDSEIEINLGANDGPRFPVREINFSENGKYFITYSKFYTKPHIILWDANSWNLLETYDTPTFLEDAQISFDGSLVTSLSSNSYSGYTLYLWHNELPLSE